MPHSGRCHRKVVEEVTDDNAFLSGLVKGVAKAPEIDEADMNTMFETNVTGLINMTQAILPVFKKHPDGGQGDIINIGSIAGKWRNTLSVDQCRPLLSQPLVLYPRGLI